MDKMVKSVVMAYLVGLDCRTLACVAFFLLAAYLVVVGICVFVYARFDGTRAVGLLDQFAEAYPEMPRVETTFSRRELKRVRGRRGGFYVKATSEYNSILGLSQPQYEEILAGAQVFFFGKTVSEAYRSSLTKLIVKDLQDRKIFLPSTQLIKLLAQVWCDLTVGEGPEDHVDTVLHENRGIYWSRFLLRSGAPSDDVFSRLWKYLLVAVSFGWYIPEKSGLPTE